MIRSRAVTVFVIVFAVVYPIAYLIAVQKNYALFTYHPAMNQFGVGVEKPQTGPAMYWYGWLATAGMVAFAAGLVAASLPERWTKGLRSGWSWLVPLCAMFAFAYLLRNYFLR